MMASFRFGRRSRNIFTLLKIFRFRFTEPLLQLHSLSPLPFLTSMPYHTIPQQPCSNYYGSHISPRVQEAFKDLSRTRSHAAYFQDEDAASDSARGWGMAGGVVLKTPE